MEVLRTQPPPDSTPVILYDGSCNLCRAQLGHMRWLSRDRVVAAPLQERLRDFPGLSREEALREIKLIAADGRVYGGTEGLIKLLEIGYPFAGRPLYTFYQLSGIKAISDGLYAWVARNRYRWFGRTEDCEDGSCGVHVDAREAAAEERETTPSARPDNPA